jgi:hypothetical protein
MRVIFIEPAAIELDDAVEYYNEQLSGLGERFFDEVLHTIDVIKSFPEGWSESSENTRKAVLISFPYTLVYAIDNDTVVIIAIAHHHRKPEYWIDRAK